jgi:hypothetical protein
MGGTQAAQLSVRLTDSFADAAAVKSKPKLSAWERPPRRLDGMSVIKQSDVRIMGRTGRRTSISNRVVPNWVREVPTS